MRIPLHPAALASVPYGIVLVRDRVFSPRLARARVSLSCESACRAHAGAVFMQKFLSCQKTYGAISRRYLRGEQAGMLNARALGQSAQAEQDTLTL